MFDLALGRAIAPPVHFDVGLTLQTRLREQDATGLIDEQEELDTSPFWLAEPFPSSLPPSTPALPSSLPPRAPTPGPSLPARRPIPADLTPDERNKLKSKIRRDKKREDARISSANPLLKSVNRKRIQEGKAVALDLDLDAGDLPHSKPAWIGSRAAQEDDFEFTEPAAPHDLGTGLGDASYTQAEVDQLSGTVGFMYIDWLGRYVLHS